MNKYREEEIRKCNHCFALIEKGEWVGGFHSSDYEYKEDIIECVKCGLTNKRKKLEAWMYSANIPFPFNVHMGKLFDNLIYDKKKKQIPFDIQKLNMLSYEEIGTNIPRIIYHLAKEVNLNINIDNPFSYPLIVKTMKELIALAIENDINVTNSEQGYKLIDLYNKNKKFIKEIK